MDKTKIAKIDDKDVEKFNSMQKLLGMCVENTNELSDTIKISFEFKETMKKIRAKIEEENARELDNADENFINEFSDRLASMTNAQKSLSENRPLLIQSI